MNKLMEAALPRLQSIIDSGKVIVLGRDYHFRRILVIKGNITDNLDLEPDYAGIDTRELLEHISREDHDITPSRGLKFTSSSIFELVGRIDGWLRDKNRVMIHKQQDSVIVIMEKLEQKGNFALEAIGKGSNIVEALLKAFKLEESAT